MGKKKQQTTNKLKLGKRQTRKLYKESPKSAKRKTGPSIEQHTHSRNFALEGHRKVGMPMAPKAEIPLYHQGRLGGRPLPSRRRKSSVASAASRNKKGGGNTCWWVLLVSPLVVVAFFFGTLVGIELAQSRGGGGTTGLHTGGWVQAGLCCYSTALQQQQYRSLLCSRTCICVSLYLSMVVDCCERGQGRRVSFRPLSSSKSTPVLLWLRPSS